MPHFVESRGDLVRANLPPDRAVALAAALGVDALAKDVVGDKTLGAMGRVMVDQNTIDEWIRTYEKGLDELIAGI